MRSFLSLHLKAPLEAVQAFLEGPGRGWLGGLGAYLVPDPPWTSLYLEGLEAEEDPQAVQRFLGEASRVGPALAFLVLEEENLLFLWAEGGRVLARMRKGPELGEEFWGPEELKALLPLPPLSAVQALAGRFGLHPDHALLGFLDLWEAEEEEGLPEEVVYLE